VQRLLFNGLLKYDAKLRLVPDLAAGYEYLSNTRLRIKLRDGVRFHNGKSLKAGDVRYTLESIVKPGSRSPLAGTFSKIAKIHVIDDLTLEIELKEPFAPFLTALTVGIVPEGAQIQPAGTGPFRLKKKKKDQWIYLVANSDYFEEPPTLNSVVFATVRDDTTRVLQILRGEVDLVQNAIPLVMAKWLEGQRKLDLMTDAGINYAYLAFNLRDEILKNRKVRQALGMAIDREALIRFQLRGFARPASGILAPSNWYYEGNVSQLEYDPEVAKGLLDEAGFPDPDGDGPEMRFEVEYKTSNRRDRIAMARAIARYWEAIGVGVTVKPFEWGTFYRDIRTGNFQIYSSTWVGVTDPDIYHYIFHSGMIPPEGANRGYYQNETVDQLLELARAETDPQARKAYYSQVQKLIALELPYLSLWYEDNVAFLRQKVEGYSLRPDASFIGLTETRVLGQSADGEKVSSSH
jgi:peptide/nickel transport system substrate-binding protein